MPRSTFERDPHAGEIDLSDARTPRRTLAERYNTRRSTDHQQGGTTFEQGFGEDRLHATVYGSSRQVLRYLPFSRALQAPPTNSGGVVYFDRDFYGADLNWLFIRQLGGGKISTRVGVDIDRSTDDRRGFENFVADQTAVQYGIKGRYDASKSKSIFRPNGSVDPRCLPPACVTAT